MDSHKFIYEDLIFEYTHTIMELYETFLPPQPITSCRWRNLPPL